jgi:hypothetical protein
MLAVLQDRLDTWTASLKPLLDRRAALDQARASAFAKDSAKRAEGIAKVREIWSGRAKDPVAVPADIRALAAALDSFERGWRDRWPLAGANASMESLDLETVALTPGERAMLARSREIAAQKTDATIQLLNDARAMLGRPRIGMHAELMQLARDLATAHGKADPLPGVGFVCVEAKSFEAALDGWLTGAELEPLADPVWVAVGTGEAGGWYAIALGMPK